MLSFIQSEKKVNLIMQVMLIKKYKCWNICDHEPMNVVWLWCKTYIINKLQPKICQVLCSQQVTKDIRDKKKVKKARKSNKWKKEKKNRRDKEILKKEKKKITNEKRTKKERKLKKKRKKKEKERFFFNKWKKNITGTKERINRNIWYIKISEWYIIQIPYWFILLNQNNWLFKPKIFFSNL